MSNQNTSNQIKQELENSSTVAIFGHENIDGDCIGSMLGLGRLLQKQGKKVKYFTPKTPGKIYNFIEGINKIKTKFDYKKDYDICLFVDFSYYDRIDGFTLNKEKYFDQQNIIVIDHHIGKTPPNSKYILKDEGVTSCCEWIFEHTIHWWPDLFDHKIATYFYLGLTTDSGNFLYDSGEYSIRILENATKLIKLGAQKQKIIDNIFYRKTIESIKFYEIIISRMQIQGGILYSYFDTNELEEYGVDTEEAKSGFMNILTKVYGPKLYILISKRNDKIKGSIRNSNTYIDGDIVSNRRIDCSKIANELFNGGGHKNAAGFAIKDGSGDIKLEIKKIIKKIEEYLISIQKT